ncbi:MAG TPA: hemolysin III family protein [Bacteroidetes bacterium]|nr:hemolysin III family protein [Bacteroidota bacterium]
MNFEQIAREERLNTLTHGFGVLLSIAGLVIMLVVASQSGSALSIVCAAIFGATLIALYAASTVYHYFHAHARVHTFKLLDHAAIYLLIAGSYTPFTLLGLGGAWGWSIFGTIWGLAVAGLVFKLLFIGKYPRLSTTIYLLMGWLIVVATQPMLERMPGGAWFWIIAGGLSYTLGVFFYTRKRMPYAHAIWHLFVLGGSVCHFFGVLFYLLP